MFLKKLNKLRKTLAFRLTLWYGTIFILFSLISFILFFYLITSVIKEGTDQDLKKEISSCATVMSIEGIDAVKQYIVLESQAAGEKKIFYRLLYSNGIVFSSSNMSYWKHIGFSRDAIQKLQAGSEPVFDTIKVEKIKHQVRVVYGLINRDTVLQVGYSMDGYSKLIETFRKKIFVVMLSLFIVAAITGLFMARKALKGVEDVTKTARLISEGDLEKRVPVKAREDEIDQMAITFNMMLDKIQSLITGIKEMSDNIAHDLRSPIARIRGIAEISLTTGASKEELMNTTGSTIEECDRLLYMINTMLFISKTEAGVGVLDFENVDTEALVKDAVSLFMPMAEDKSVILNSNIIIAGTISGDIQMMQRALTNLIDNAIKYTDAYGTVTVTLNKSTDENNIVIDVKDTGTGISEKDRTQIFNRFYRCDKSRSQVGTGLGLSLARTIARAHGGDIVFKDNPVRGSVFTLKIPVSNN
ncbi:MAG: HAMP domain-containing protein [Desulfobacterales bacterium]|nr:HAMP domain-containing protein [Desulfobacterales bacterium]MCP4158743.1 HAMP domain-containing protein [Deltaproteobacteria bacterium]